MIRWSVVPIACTSSVVCVCHCCFHAVHVKCCDAALLRGLPKSDLCFFARFHRVHSSFSGTMTRALMAESYSCSEINSQYFTFIMCASVGFYVANFLAYSCQSCVDHSKLICLTFQVCCQHSVGFFVPLLLQQSANEFEWPQQWHANTEICIHTNDCYIIMGWNTFSVCWNPLDNTRHACIWCGYSHILKSASRFVLIELMGEMTFSPHQSPVISTKFYANHWDEIMLRGEKKKWNWYNQLKKEELPAGPKHAPFQVRHIVSRCTKFHFGLRGITLSLIELFSVFTCRFDEYGRCALFSPCSLVCSLFFSWIESAIFARVTFKFDMVVRH